MKIPVVIVDDHASVRQMLALVLAIDGGYEVVGEGRTGLEGLRICAGKKPHLLITDLSLPEMSGSELVQRLRTEMRALRILIYSGTQHRNLTLTALRARPHGFVQKRDSLQTLREALKAVAAGSSYLSPFAMRLLDESPVASRAGDQLSVRERSVLQMVAEGMSSKEIAHRLGIAAKTVDHHRGHIMQKLGLRDVAGLTRFAVGAGIVAAEES